MTSDALAAFLEARLAEDAERAARSQALRDKLDDPHREIRADVRDGAEYAWLRTGADPARMIRGVAAIRAILAEHEPQRGWDGDSYDGAVCRTCCWREMGEGNPEGDPWPCATLRMLAAVYADSADYRAEWAPVPAEGSQA